LDSSGSFDEQPEGETAPMKTCDKKVSSKEQKCKGKILIKKCHVCGHLMESTKELERCPACDKSFLPTNYFGKIHAKNSAEFKNLYADCNELCEEDLVKGIHVIW